MKFHERELHDVVPSRIGSRRLGVENDERPDEGQQLMEHDSL